MAGILLIIQNLNGDRWLMDCLSSAEALKKANPEHLIDVIVLDAGSTDRSLAIISRFPYFELLQHDMLPQAAAINRALKPRLQLYDYFAMINCDDYWLPPFIEQQIRLMKVCPDTDVAHGRCLMWWEQNKIISIPHTWEWEETFRNRWNNISQPTLFFPRRTFEKYGLLDESIIYPYDFEFTARVWKNGGIIRFNDCEPLAFYRVRIDNLTSTKNDAIMKDVEIIKAKYL